jgi:hypothetical protein
MLIEDLSIFLADFAKPVSANGVSGLGILDAPGEYVSEGRAISDEYVLRVKTSEFGSLAYGNSVTVDGQAYTVREAPLKIGDGVFCLVLLTLATVVETIITTLSGLNITTLAGDPLITL